jgi:hypothetical protein
MTMTPVAQFLKRLACILAVVLGVGIIWALRAKHSGPHANAAPLLMIAGIIFYAWATFSLARGACYVRGCPQGGFTPDEDPFNFYFAICGLYAVDAMWVFLSFRF